MTIENELKEYILNHYKSIRDFCVKNGFPYSTIDNLFKRRMFSSSSLVIIRVCNCLNISLDELYKGKIIEKPQITSNDLSDKERYIISSYRSDEEVHRIIDGVLSLKAKIN